MEENYKLAQWLEGKMSAVELKEFEADEDYILFEKIKKHSAELQTSNFDEDKMLNNIFLTPKSSTITQEAKVISIQKNWFLKIAAIIVVGFGILFATTSISNTNQIALNGTKNTFLLPDNSQVVLNAGSTADYKKWSWRFNRSINLQGEAYFKVSKGEKFDVTTSLGKVSVLGTQFNVKARNNRFDVVCFEGKVKVNYNNEEVIVTQGQTVAFENNKKIFNGVTSLQKPSWTANEIQFEKENIANIIAEVERQYNIKIELKNNASPKLFTGIVPKNNLETALQTITSVYQLNYSKSNNKNYIIQ